MIHRRHTFILPFSNPELANRFAFRSSKHPEKPSILAGSDEAIGLTPEDKIDLIEVYDFQHPRQDKITFPFKPYELGSSGSTGKSSEKFDEIRAGLAAFKQVSIQWTSKRSPLANSPPPALSQVFSTTPGLYITVTPNNPRAKPPISWNFLRSWLSKFGVSNHVVESNNNPFIRIGNLFMYYDLSLRDEHVSPRFLESLCGKDDDVCKDQIHEIYFADSISISYQRQDNDDDDQELVVDVAWMDRERIREYRDLAPTLTRTLVKQPNQDLSLGLLATDESWSDKSEYAMVGRVFTFDQDEEEEEVHDEEISEPVLFTANYRHIPVDFTTTSKSATCSYNWTIETPPGLHPKLLLEIDGVATPPDLATIGQVGGQCSLQVLMTLPKSLFLDIYQIDNNANQNQYKLEKIFPPSAELEAPEWLVKEWGSISLFRLTPPPSTNTDRGYKYEFPLHTRYKSLKSRNETKVEIGYPTVFWSCTRSPADTIHPSLEMDYSTLMTLNQFESPGSLQSVLYKELFPPDTTFHHLIPHDQTRIIQVDVPLLEPSNGSLTIYISIIVVVIAFVYLAAKSVFAGGGHQEKRKTA